MKDRTEAVCFATKATSLLLADDTLVELHGHMHRLVGKVEVSELGTDLARFLMKSKGQRGLSLRDPVRVYFNNKMTLGTRLEVDMCTVIFTIDARVITIYYVEVQIISTSEHDTN